MKTFYCACCQRFIGLLPILSLLLIANVSNAKVKLPQLFSSNMVLQCEEHIRIWGWADKKEEFDLVFNGTTTGVKADRKGRWQVELDSLPPGGPYNLLIYGQDTIELTNIFSGDVWLCSGQSNMEWPMHQTNNAQEEIELARYPRIRLFTVDKKVSTVPLDSCEAEGWMVCTPESVKNFSAVAYFFGRKLNEDLDRPIGLIHSSWGGTNVETWTSAESIEKLEGFEGVSKELQEYDEAKMIAKQREQLESVTGPLPDEDLGLIDGKVLWASDSMDYDLWQEMELPQLWESAGLINLDGLVWYQKTFVIEPGDKLDEVEIHLGPIDDSDITYLNGAKIGQTEQKYNEPRIYTLEPNALKIGENSIVIRVEDTGGGGGIYGDADAMFVKLKDKKIALSGSWRYKVGKASFASATGPNSMPALLYNAMIHPLIRFKIKGAIWYQGESNAGRAYQYRTTFPNMIRNWREQWNLGDFPFLYVQLANYMASTDNPNAQSEWAELREAQSMTLTLPNTGMATAIDIGEADDIHPRNKQDVGRRLALGALKIAYQRDLVHSGPTFRDLEIDDSKAIVSFDHMESGVYLKNRYGYINGFAIAGEDQVFHWAKAELIAGKVIVSSEEVKDPVAVRYGWANNPADLNLYNMEGLPAVPFRTDDWPGITIDAKYR